MKQDLDRLMAARGLDAMLVRGKVLGNPPLVYLLNGAHLTQAVLVKRCGDSPTLIVGPMDRVTAAATGYEVVLTTRYNYAAFLEEHAGDELAASVAYYRSILEDLGISGRLGCYGYMDQGYAYAFLSALNAATPDVEIVGEVQEDIIRKARATKDAEEVARIRDVGRRTARVVSQSVAFLQSHAVDGEERLVASSGQVLTVDDVHHEINRLIAAEGLEDPEGFIFATGADAGIPHSRGTPDAPMRLGETIVFDIFPREVGGGYFFDLTRTFCLGYAPEPAATLHREVLMCLRTLKAKIRAGEETRRYQQMACAYFRDLGHPTIDDDPATQEGYVHTLGHGVGLDIHEAPWFRDDASNSARLEPGHLFAFEPGLYYPERGMGCRVEDVLWVAEDGTVYTLTELPYALVVPMDGTPWGKEEGR
jgi:Xaa-Pro aminopeptidase